MTFKAFRNGVQQSIPSLSRNNIFRVNKWSRIEEAICFLNNAEESHQENVLKEQIHSMKPTKVGEKRYSPETLIRAFEYYSTSRCLYERIRKDYKLPSVNTLTNLTSKVNNTSDKAFIKEVFSNLPDERQKQCVILVDKIFFKKMASYHAAQLFGKAKNKDGELATAALGIMVKCLFGGPTFLFKMVPVQGLDAKFLYDQVIDTIDLIKSVGGEPTALVFDGNRTNQKLVKKFDTVENKPWLSKDGLYLLFDYVHLMKNIRNSWLTQSVGELQFERNKKLSTAKWSHLVDLFKLEQAATVNDRGVRGIYSKLNEISVNPKPVERQKVATCLRVFSEETIAALRTHSEMKSDEVEGTAVFLEKVVKMWKILNVRSKGKDVRRNDPLVAPIESPDDPRLKYLLDIADMFLSMGKKEKGKRKKELTRDTAKCLHHTLNGIVELCKMQLETTHSFVLLGDYSNDPIEGAFGKLRQGSGGTYFLNVQQVMEKLDIAKTRLLLKLNADVSNFNVDVGHECDLCKFLMDDKSSETFDHLLFLEDEIDEGTKMSLVHMAGYVTRKDPEKSEEELFTTTTFYYQKYGKFTESLDRGGLNIPTDNACQWTFFCFVMFQCVKDKVCRKSLANIFMIINDMHTFNMERRHGIILANIFFKNYAIELTPRSTKEPKLKVLKLSESKKING